jgi:hypothetical protein
MNGTSGPGGEDALALRSDFSGTWTPHNKRMHATADTRDVIFGQLVGRRVMRSVMPLRLRKHRH